MSADRFPLQIVLPSKRYVIRDERDRVIAEVNADSAAEAFAYARERWPATASAIIKSWEPLGKGKPGSNGATPLRQ